MWKSKWVLGVVVLAVVGGYLVVDALRSPTSTAVGDTQPVTDSTAKRDLPSRTTATSDTASTEIVTPTTPAPATPAPETPAGTSRPSAPVAPTFDPAALRKLRGQPMATNAPHVSLDAVARAEQALANGDYDAASAMSRKALSVAPGDTRMLRVAVQSSCMKGDAAAAKELNAKLSLVDQRAMIERCRDHGTPIAHGGGAGAGGGE